MTAAFLFEFVPHQQLRLSFVGTTWCTSARPSRYPGGSPRMSGYSRADGTLPTGSMLAAPLRWAGRTGAEVAGRTVRVRFHTPNARIYALYRN